MSNVNRILRKAIVRCMRLSFQLALATTALSALLGDLGAWTQLVAIAWSAAAVLGILWVTHLFVLALRAVAAKRALLQGHAKQTQASVVHGLKPVDSASHPSRRALLVTFARVAAVAAVATSVGLPRKSVADQGCSCATSCYSCCTCLQSECLNGCKNKYPSDPDGYNTCIGQCADASKLCNCNCGGPCD
jgi:hypothetical protein